MRGNALEIRVDERARRILDERARRADESVARAAGRVVAGVLGLAFEVKICGRAPRHYKPAVVCRTRRRPSPTGSDPIYVSCSAPMREKLRAAARANGTSERAMFAQLLHGALGLPFRPLPPGPPKLRTPEEQRLHNAERSNRYYHANREKVLRRQSEAYFNLSEEKKARLRAYKREWAARKREAERAAEQRIARPAGW